MQKSMHSPCKTWARPTGRAPSLSLRRWHNWAFLALLAPNQPPRQRSTPALAVSLSSGHRRPRRRRRDSPSPIPEDRSSFPPKFGAPVTPPSSTERRGFGLPRMSFRGRGGRGGGRGGRGGRGGYGSSNFNFNGKHEPHENFPVQPLSSALHHLLRFGIHPWCLTLLPCRRSLCPRRSSRPQPRRRL
jgi:hypothetical protein